MNHKKKKDVDIYSYLSYHSLLSFEWKPNHGVEGGKFMCSIMCKGKLRMLIGSLAMCVGF